MEDSIMSNYSDYIVIGADQGLDTTDNVLFNDVSITNGIINLNWIDGVSELDIFADGGGITLHGDTDKTILWVDATDSWDFNQSINITGDITQDKSPNTTSSIMIAGAGNVTMSGSYNTLIGESAGNNISTGANNTLIGFESGNFASEGADNTFIGNSSGWANTLGNSNIFIGNSAGYYNLIGNDNFCVGFEAGQGVIAQSYSNNVYIGFESGQLTETGSNNTFIGYQSGKNNTTGSNNICFGTGSQTSSVSATYQCIIGNTTTPTLVGIGGNDNPQYALDVLGDVNITGDFLVNGNLPLVNSDPRTTTTETLALVDGGKLLTFSNVSSTTLTVPANASVAFPVNTVINLLNINTGAVSVAITTDTLNSKGSFVQLVQGSAATLVKTGVTTWWLFGDLI
jgi:hypothetical protein